MNFNEAIIALEEGKKIRRTGWKFPKDAYLELSSWYCEKIIYMCNQQVDNPRYVTAYGPQYEDIKANDWEIKYTCHGIEDFEVVCDKLNGERK